MSGPPGTGKTLIAQSLPSIMPRMSVDGVLEVTEIYGVAGLLPDNEPLLRARPFHTSYHAISYTGFVEDGA